MTTSFPGRCTQAPSVHDWLEASCRHLPLAEGTVLELSRRIQAWQRHPGGPEQAPAGLRRRALRARDQLVRHNLRLIAHTWRCHRSSLPAEQEATADAFQEAALSLVRAAEKFDPARGYRFSTYASFWVRRGFSTHERTAKRMIRLPHDKAAVALRALRLAEEHQTATGVTPKLAWLAQRCGPRGSALPVESLQELLELWARTRTAELNRSAGADGEEPGPERLERLADRHRGCTASAVEPEDEQRALLPQLLESLDPLARRLLWHRYLREHPLSPRQLQRLLGLTVAEQEALEQSSIEQLRQTARKLGAL